MLWQLLATGLQSSPLSQSSRKILRSRDKFVTTQPKQKLKQNKLKIP